MNYTIDTQEPLPKAVAKALSDYIAKYGPPPPMTESIQIEVNGRVVVIELFTMKETE